jgi:hypothetical protein
MKVKLRYILFMILIARGAFASSQSEAEEYNLKAAFIYNFTNFIDWGTASVDEPFVIGIIGSSLINEPLAEIARTKTVNNRRIIIRQFNNPDEITFCNILFISEKSLFPLDEILNKTASQKTLVISERNGYALHGSCINFVVINDKLKFETNINALNAAGLKASSQLLKLAIIVN